MVKTAKTGEAEKCLDCDGELWTRRYLEPKAMKWVRFQECLKCGARIDQQSNSED